jgi:ribonuclease E
VQGDDAWDTIQAYVTHVAPDLVDRLKRHVGNIDVFTEYRIDEQILKALDRKVWLPSGGYLVIDRTEAMTVVDVNTGKFTGSGGNLEETVTRNNLEAAEEIVRQLRLRDIGGIIVVDFIDMVLESNRDLVLRRLTECLGRDRTRHQVAEVTSLGLVQMTRKRVGTGLLEAFSTSCEHCRGRGIVVSTTPVHAHGGAAAPATTAAPASTGNGGANGGGNGNGNGNGGGANNGHQQGSGRRNRHRGQDKSTQDATTEPQADQTPEPAPEPEPQPVAEQTPEPQVTPEPVVEQAQVQPPVERVTGRIGGPVRTVTEPVVTEPEAPEPHVPAQQSAEPEPVAEVRHDESVTPDEPEVHSSTNGHHSRTPAVAVANPPRPTRRRAASRPAGPPAGQAGQ